MGVSMPDAHLVLHPRVINARTPAAGTLNVSRRGGREVDRGGLENR